MTGVPNNNDHHTLSVLMDAHRYGSGSNQSTPAQWQFCGVGLRKESARVSNSLIVYI